eukprot:TRINITY_DN687_c0_g1_i2.p1 TRINITY_DN687_c0_g1~~TRINITY_DN687_c0_g1_i2.p1  ORF type:complete len:409 (+),score=4.97 TRINITY_DN687_c0_g1_i2:167-1228(+)
MISEDSFESSSYKSEEKTSGHDNTTENSQNAIGIDYFVSKKMAELYICPICLNVPHPSSAIEHKDCGKIFCKSCIHEWSQKEPSCPNCNKQLESSSKVNLSLALKNTMGMLEIKCLNVPADSDECKWVDEWDRLAAHNDTCPYALVPCPNGCRKMILRKDFDHHLTNMCKTKQMHCRYAEVGCTAKVRRKDLAKHEDEEKGLHLELIWEYLQKLKAKLFKLEDEKEKRIQQIRCKNGHFLVFTTHCPDCSEYYCDICEEPNNFSCGSWRCTPCDFDICSKCHRRCLEETPQFLHFYTLTICPHDAEIQRLLVVQQLITAVKNEYRHVYFLYWKLKKVLTIYLFLCIIAYKQLL